jgi:acyl-[acyl-carrier-protein]-phospholipid O-acyltransferase / long-chain-fatty-acid--[acyl-carrier-protein] ligase
MFLALLSSRRFAPLFLCQFFSALNDNFLKNALGMLILFKLAGGEGATHGSMLITLSGVVFIAPFFILSALGGKLADRYDKALVARYVRLAELPIAALAACGFALTEVPLLFAALGGFGIVATLFGPVKYGLLPERLMKGELSAGNALVEGATFLAILSGTIGGAIAGTGAATLVVAVILALSIASWLAARAIPTSEPAAPELVITANPWTSTRALLRLLLADRRLASGAHFVSWFWLVGFLVLALLPALAGHATSGGARLVTTWLGVFTLGIAVGSWLAARASRDEPNLALVPLGALLMGLSALLIARVAAVATAVPAGVAFGGLPPSSTGLILLLGLLGLAVAGGLFIVPAFTVVQSWAPVERRARVIAAVNILNSAYMVAGGAVVAAVQAAGVGPAPLFAALGMLCLVAAALILRAWGAEALRGFARLLLGLFFRLEVDGIENVPPNGEAVIFAPNHVSLLDGPILNSVLPQRAAFAVNTQIAQTWWVRPLMNFIPAHLLDPIKPLAARTLVNALKGGASIVIFPEGRITVTGGLMKVYDGTAMIADKASAAILPVRIDGAERSPFSYLRRTQTRKALFPKVKVTFLPPRRLQIDAALKGRARRQAAGRALQDMMVEAAVATARIDRTLFAALVDARARAARDIAVADALGSKLTHRQLIAAAQTLAGKLVPLTSPGAAVGILLPNVTGAAVAFFALHSIGCVPAMINYTAGAASIAASIRAAGVSVILTSHAAIERGRLQGLIARLQASQRIVYLEDVRAAIGPLDKLRGLLAGTRPRITRRDDDLAVILFTSGSEGAPKGVVLSNRNILANCAQCLARVDANGEDTVFNALPLFHAFGLTGGLIMPLVGGVPVSLYPSPLHYRIVPELLYDTCATIMFATNTFLAGYARVAHPYDLRNLRLLISGGEPVTEDVRKAYMDRFGVRILEGYGVTETAPVLALNTPIANRAGSVGRLSPLMQARLEPVPGIEGAGRLIVRGPNVMIGYYRPESPGVLDPPPDGWHDTGDIVSIDPQGFITVRGRAKRFAKIAGEMVSLAAIEAMLREAMPGIPLVVVAVPDARRGERTVLVTSCASASREALQHFAKARGAAELMLPSEIVVVDSVPLLGSGKPDIVAATALVSARSRPSGGTVAA